MESKAKILGHPIHQMVVPFALGVLGMAVLFDVIALIKGDWDSLSRAAYYMIGAGIIAALVSAVFGVIDWFAIPMHTRAKKIATVHGVGNVVIVVLFIIAWLIRHDTPPKDASGWPIALEVIGVLGALVTGWLGGELVDRLGVGVEPGANLDAPSSLSGRRPTIGSTGSTNTGATGAVSHP